MTTFNTHRYLSEFIAEPGFRSEHRLTDIIAGSETAADRPDVYAITLRIAGEAGATNTNDLTEAVTHAVAQLDEAHGIYVVQPVIAERVDPNGQNASLIDEHLGYALTESGLDGTVPKITLKRDANGIEIDLTEPIDVRADSTSRIDAHRTTAESTEHHFRAW